MAVSSMTAFARAGGSYGAYSWTWEFRSVNGRGLDLRCRFPSGYDGLESEIRKRLNARFSRGSINVNLRLERNGSDVTVRINEPVLEQLTEAAKRLRNSLPDATVSVDGLLAVRGVVEIADSEDGDDEAAKREALILADADVALEQLATMRGAEGKRLSEILRALLETMEGCVAGAATAAAAQPDAILDKLNAQMAALDDRPDALSDERLAQEVALLAAKADVREELDRLGAHLAAARELIAEGGVIGRKLDFLAQEFNREANTLVSKSADLELTQYGLELKTAIDQFREQGQNIE